MPILERLRDELALQKQLFFAAVGVVLGLFGWLATNVHTANWLLITGGSIIVISSAIYAYTRYQLLQEIEDV